MYLAVCLLLVRATRDVSDIMLRFGICVGLCCWVGRCNRIIWILKVVMLLSRLFGLWIASRFNLMLLAIYGRGRLEVFMVGVLSRLLSSLISGLM